MAEHFHLAVAWDWEYDAPFIRMLEHAIHRRALTFFSISHHNTHETVRRLKSGQVTFGTFLDRAADVDDNFPAVARAIHATSTRLINNPVSLVHANDKATMHLEFITAGLNVPFTIIISPYAKKRELELSLTDLACLGRPFIIKPANTTGGGIGVVTGAESLKDVIESRQHHKHDKYLLQQKILPATLAGRKAWFRVFWVFSRIIPCWWDDVTHVYAPVSDEELSTYRLEQLHSITDTIARVCGLDFFSTEVALTPDGRFVVVDYVNDICDMRLQSRHPDGVPDQIVSAVCEEIALALARTSQSPAS